MMKFNRGFILQTRHGESPTRLLKNKWGAGSIAQ